MRMRIFEKTCELSTGSGSTFDSKRRISMATSETEVRRRHRDEGAEENEGADDEVSPQPAEDSEPAPEGTDYWDLDDDDQWGSSSYSTSELAKKRKVLRRSNLEVGIAFACHLILMCYYIYVHVYDATIVKRNKGEGFDYSYGGRWKFLTYINIWVQFIFYFLCFFTDIMPRSYFKVKFQRACDLIFTTTAAPMSFFVFVLFWSIYAYDRELIHPKSLDKLIPFELNQQQHTGIMVTSLIEIMVVFHRYPSNLKAFMLQFFITTAYLVWIVWVFSVTGKWAYPFLAKLPLPIFPIFCAINLLFYVGFYYIGKVLCYFRWRERHQLMNKLGL